MKKPLLLSLVTFLFFITPVAPFFTQNQAIAATVDYVDRDFPDAMDAAKTQSDMNAPGHVASVNTTMYSDLIRRFAGPVKGVTTNSTDPTYLNQMYKESFVAGAESIVTYVYTNPPASTYAFARDIGQSLGFIPKTAYAQGIGFSGLTQLLPMWKAFRNIAYLLLAIFMIVIGFLIMFRKKIDPKTVVTIQSALPNIVVTLLLITFSYAIVGILIDFMYLIIMVAISILQPISNGAIDKTTAQTFVSSNFVLVIQKFGLGGLGAWNDIAAMLGPWGSGIGVGLPVTLGIIGVATANPITALAAPILLIVFIILAFLIAIVRLLFLLISAYMQIILSLLISPFQLLLGAFPGSHAFEGWIKNLIANLAVFPITAIMLLIGSILVKADYSGTKLWGPPLLAPAGSGILGGGMGGIIGLGILFAIPSVAGSIKEALKAKPMVNAGGAIGQMLSSPTSSAMQGINLAYQMKMLTGKSVLDVFKIGGKAPEGQ